MTIDMIAQQKTKRQMNMSALFLERMQPDDIDDVLAIENDVYPFPWTRRNFMDSIASGYEAWKLCDTAGVIQGYFLLMLSVDDAHLLNIAVARALQGRGMGLLLLDKVRTLVCAHGKEAILLEVRPSNHRAMQMYLHYGFNQIGTRLGYYPDKNNTREDAIVMRLIL